MSKPTYRLAETPTAAETGGLPFNERIALADFGGARSLGAVRTGEFRPPKRGEWYLSGAIPAAYKAPNDLSSPYHILKLVRVERTTVVTEKVLPI